jgi:uncharacterized OB-fold protein
MSVTQFSFDTRVVIPPHTKLVRFFEELKAGKLMGTKCKKCGKLFFPPRADCNICLSSDMEWVEMKGNGKLLSYTITYFAPKAYVKMAPYAIGVAQLDQGPKLSAWIRGVKFEDLKIGMRLKVTIEKCEDDIIRYILRPE